MRVFHDCLWLFIRLIIPRAGPVFAPKLHPLRCHFAEEVAMVDFLRCRLLLNVDFRENYWSFPRDKISSSTLDPLWKYRKKFTEINRNFNYTSINGKSISRENHWFKYTTRAHKMSKSKGMFFIYCSIQSVEPLKALYTLPSLTDLFIPTPTRLLCEAF